MGVGKLQFQLYYGEQASPVSDAEIVIIDTETGIPLVEGPLSVNENGKSEIISLYTPDKILSLIPQNLTAPYSTYDAIIISDTFKDYYIKDIEIFPQITSVEMVQMQPLNARSNNNLEKIILTPHGLLLDVPQAKETLNPILPGKEPKLLSKPVIPKNIIVHLGTPNSNATNVTVPFIDYIKNVASSEIYPTWPSNAIRANVYAQISFALNRVYTEWYKSRGYNFDITNSTAYDHYYVHGRSIFDTISIIVDDIFDNYISRVDFLEPLLAQYCNGTTVTCAGLSQWGTVDLANMGLTPYEILVKYYGNNIELRTAPLVSIVTESYPGTPLRLGSTGDDVKTIQSQLNRIAKNYPAIPIINPVNGNFNSTTEEAVKVFQKVFNLTVDGIVGKATWYKISQIYVGVKKLGELESEGEKIPIPTTPPSSVIKKGSTGELVKLAQFFLSAIGAFYDNIPPVEITGIFDDKTEVSTKAFQQKFGLVVDGIIGENTWNKLYEIFLTIKDYIFTESGSLIKYPGYLIRQGARGSDVKNIQKWLFQLSKKYSQIPSIDVDGIFGAKTKSAIIAFQRLFNLAPDGIVGPLTWNKLYSEFIKSFTQ